jgi:hypothetical protein
MMGKYSSMWINRDLYYENIAEPGNEPHYHPYQRPSIVCLCGSGRFKEEFDRVNAAETAAGRIVLAPGSHSLHGPEVVDVELKRRLDWLHMRKVELADEVLILNVGKYIGPSTQRELDYARALGKPIRYLEPDQEV